MDWRCTSCGVSHPRNNPPCHECGGMDFEQVVVRLEWACTDCSEPVESSHEPCPHCGGTDFERLSDSAPEGPEPLVDDVRLKSSSEQQQQQQQIVDNVVWECPHCGKRHMRNSPPCTRCGNAQLEKVPFEAAIDTDIDEDGSELGLPSLGLFEHTSSTLSLVGLTLATLGGLLVMYGGLIGASPVYLLGITIGLVGAGVVLFDTRHRDSSPDSF